PGPGDHARPGSADGGDRAAGLDPPPAGGGRGRGGRPPAGHLPLPALPPHPPPPGKGRPAGRPPAGPPAGRPGPPPPAGAGLPPGVPPVLGPPATPIGEVYRYTLEGEGADPMELRTLEDWTVRPRLLQVDGVADVVSYGGLVKEIHVSPDPTRMASLGVGLSELFAALSKSSDNATGGYVERGSEAFVIRSLGIFRGVDDIGKVRVGFHEGVPVTVRDVAAVAVGYAPRQGVVTRGADPDAVEGIVLMRRGQN